MQSLHSGARTFLCTGLLRGHRVCLDSTLSRPEDAFAPAILIDRQLRRTIALLQPKALCLLQYHVRCLASDYSDWMIPPVVSHKKGSLLRTAVMQKGWICWWWMNMASGPMDSRKANLFFQLVNHMYTRSSLIVTSNVTFDTWGKVFGGDEVIAMAILDRLLHFSHVFLISGPSFRMKGKLIQALEKPPDLCDDSI